MIPKSVGIALFVLAAVISGTMIHQKLVYGETAISIYIFLYLWAVLISYTSFSLERVCTKSFDSLRARTQEAEIRSIQQYRYLKPEERNHLRARRAGKYKALVLFSGIGTVLTTFLINPIAGSIVSYRVIKWVKDEWNSTDESSERHENRNSQSRVA